MKTVEQISLDHLLDKAHEKLPEGAWRHLREALERARVVGVLDAFCYEQTRAHEGCYSWQSIPACGGGLDSVVIKVQGEVWRTHEGPTPAAARAAAAEAIEARKVQP